MGLFVVGAAIALFIGMQLARHMDGSKGARAEYQKAKDAVPAARKKAYGTTFGFARFALVLALILIAVAWGYASSDK
jgi:hypothetical protein